MASNAAATTPWPHGALYPIQLGPVSYPVEFGDSTGYKKMASFKTPFAFNVKQAYWWLEESSWVSGAGMLMRVTDDDSQTIVSARTVDTSDDTGVWMALTINDEGPVLNNAEIYLEIDSGDATGEFNCGTALLWVSPVYAPSGLDGPL